MSSAKSTARINFRLRDDLKKTIEDAAAEMGQSISDFAVSTLVQKARRIPCVISRSRGLATGTEMVRGDARRFFEHAQRGLGPGSEAMQQQVG